MLRSTAIMGGASFTNILIGLVRMKVAALLLGPTGVGWIGLLQSLMGTASTFASFGFPSGGMRQIAAAVASGKHADVANVRQALFWGTLGLALTGGLVFWLLRDVFASLISADPLVGGELGWLALGIVLSVAAGSQSALLNGMRRVGDLARLQISTAILSVVIAAGAIFIWGEDGVILFVLASPIANFMLGHYYVSRLDLVEGGPTPMNELMCQWGAMARLGVAVMFGSLVVLLGQLLVRIIVERELGASALGQFQAAWAIAMSYLGFILAAMMTDYYPRLTGIIHDTEAATRLVNEQTEIGLLLAGPVLLLMLALAPWIIRLFYTAEFGEAAQILRWQVLGDLLKVACFPLGYVLLAEGVGRVFVIKQTAVSVVFVVGTLIGLPILGIEATGVSFLLMFIVNLVLTFWLARLKIGFSWQSRVRRHLVLLAIVTVAVFMLAKVSEVAAVVVGCIAAFTMGLYGVMRLAEMVALGGPLGNLATLSRKIMERMGVQSNF